MSQNNYIEYYELISKSKGMSAEKLNEFISFLRENGFSFIKEELEKKWQDAFKPLLDFIDISLDNVANVMLGDLFEGGDSQIGISTEKGIIALFRTVMREVISKDTRLTRIATRIIHVRPKNQKRLNELCKDFLKDKKLALVSEENSKLSKIVNKKLSTLSSSGKLLSKKENIIRARALLDEKTWEIIAGINEQEGAVADSEKLTEISKKLKLNKKETKSLINSLLKKNLVYKLLQIVCRKCGAPNLRVDAKTDIKNLIENVRCGVCNNKLMASDIKEVFVLPNDVVTLVKGIWLEQYVKDIVESKCSKVWQGRYLGNDELDVVGLKLRTIFLFECKTTEIGHTDVYNAIIKARRLGADALFIITTKKFVENARKAIEEMSRTEALSIFAVEGDLKSIKNGILKHLNEEIDEKLEHFILRALGVPLYRYKRFDRTLRRFVF